MSGISMCGLVRRQDGIVLRLVHSWLCSVCMCGTIRSVDVVQDAVQKSVSFSILIQLAIFLGIILLMMMKWTQDHRSVGLR